MQYSLRPWLEGTLPCPDPGVSPNLYYVWIQNDDGLRAFILNHISSADMDQVRVEAQLRIKGGRQLSTQTSQ